MKLIAPFILFAFFAFSAVAQKGMYVKYNTKFEATTDEAEAMVGMMSGSYMEMAVSEKKTYVKTSMGSLMSMTVEYNLETDTMIMMMEGMMGTTVFKMSANEGAEDDQATDENVDITLVNETKDILGYTCKKATIKDEKDKVSVFWYTEEIARPDGVDQMPNSLPGMCLQMQMAEEDGMIATFTATELQKDIELDKYSVTIPEGTEVLSFDDMKKMGLK